jgi:hypothetical protein
MIVTIVQECITPLVPAIVMTDFPVGVIGGLEKPPLHPAISSAPAARPATVSVKDSACPDTGGFGERTGVEVVAVSVVVVPCSTTIVDKPDARPASPGRLASTLRETQTQW